MIKGGKREGKGILYKGRYKIYDGEWINDFYEGKGKEYNDMGILIRQGTFINGVLLKGIEYVLRENGVTIKEIDNCDDIKYENFYCDDFLEILDVIMEQMKEPEIKVTDDDNFNL